MTKTAQRFEKGTIEYVIQRLLKIKEKHSGKAEVVCSGIKNSYIKEIVRIGYDKATATVCIEYNDNGIPGTD